MKQLIELNKGIEELVLPGFQEHDALWFGEDKHITYKKLADSIVFRFPSVKSVLEIGSGAGSLAYWIKKNKPSITIVTLDGNKKTVNSPYIDKDNHFIVRTDEPYILSDDEAGTPFEFDLIVSFEHFEHIQPETFGVFLDNIKLHSHNDTVIIASASNWKYPPPNEHVHCNVKKKEEWYQYLANNGFQLLDRPPMANSDNVPFNFQLHLTTQFAFKKR